jgi:lipopolysaccharide transport system permease protein
MKETMVEKVTVYFPDKSIKQGYPSLFKEMFRELINSRWLTRQLFIRNFSALYRQSLLGIGWALIIPLITVGTFIFLNTSGVFNMGDMTIPYPLFAVAGMALWSIFSVGLTLSANSLVNVSAMITKINFAREPLVISAVVQGIIPSLIQIVIVFVLFACYQIVPPLTVLLVPFAVIPLFFLTLGLGFIVSLINTVLRDAGNMISLVVMFLLFLTPVLYVKPPSGLAAVASHYNPWYYLLSVPRDLLLFGGTVEWPGYLYSALFSFVIFFICWTAFHLTEARIAERI